MFYRGVFAAGVLSSEISVFLEVGSLMPLLILSSLEFPVACLAELIYFLGVFTITSLVLGLFILELIAFFLASGDTSVGFLILDSGFTILRSLGFWGGLPLGVFCTSLSFLGVYLGASRCVLTGLFSFFTSFAIIATAASFTF